MNPVNASDDVSNSKSVTRVGLTHDCKKDIHILTNGPKDHILIRNTDEGIRIVYVKAKFHEALTYAVDHFDGE